MEATTGSEDEAAKAAGADANESELTALFK
jgi:hypothetical protein